MSEFLKCDAAGCTHVETVDEITEAMIGRPCPVCGASLLTAGDWQAWRSVFRPAIEAMQEAGLVETAEPEAPGAVAVNFHDGELRIRKAAT